MNKTRNILIICILVAFIAIFGISAFNGLKSPAEDPVQDQEVIQDTVQKTDKEESKQEEDKIDKEEKKEDKKETSKEEIKEDRNESNQSSKENKTDTKKEKEESKNQGTEKQEQTNKNDVPDSSSGNVDSEGSKEESVEKVPVKTIKVSVVIKGLDGAILASEVISVEEETSAFEALKAVCDKNALEMITNGYGKFVYVRSIDGLMEKQHGANSGWKYNVNGNYISIGSGQYVLLENDVMEWYYAHD